MSVATGETRRVKAEPSRTALEYAPRGLAAVLTPQANTTVEPEFVRLLPAGYGMICGRLTSGAADLEARLVAYLDGADASLRQFANAPVGAVAFACTGSSYLAGPDGEDAAAARLSRDGPPFLTAAMAVCAALSVLGARRIGLVSPYPDSLHGKSRAYWQARGFEVAAEARIATDAGAFHPIYSIGGGAAADAIAELRAGAGGVDVVLMLGTGMPSLRAILDANGDAGGRGGAPVLSSNLALAWRTVAALDGQAGDAGGLRRWLSGADWGARV